MKNPIQCRQENALSCQTSPRVLHGLVTLCLLLLMLQSAWPQNPAPTYKLMHSFDITDGSIPQAGLVQATNGDFYGTTSFGGANSGSQCQGTTCGTVFKITIGGMLTTVHSFDGSDGFLPYDGVIQAKDGNFYGTTYGGGSFNDGTVFKMTPSGELTTLHNFGGPDGASPFGGVIQGKDGSLYGAIVSGGTKGQGVIYKVTLAGQFTTLHSFRKKEGEQPGAALVQTSDGNFYGTASQGGANGYGTVFKVTPSGKLTVLHSFDGNDGEFPVAGLVLATNGNLYGSTYASNSSNNYGTLFSITTTGKLTTLHTFDGTDGSNCVAAMIQATDKQLYGTVYNGGANNFGTAFKMTLAGKLTTLYDFNNSAGDPYANLLEGSNGKLYGTTQVGGTDNQGTVFSLAVGLHSPKVHFASRALNR
jgi:uncharacterized repeat protein (TIGR03803 family)